LGKSNVWEKIHNVKVDGAYLYNTDNGVRIKTWQVSFFLTVAFSFSLYFT
jgi:hypothetical protein